MKRDDQLEQVLEKLKWLRLPGMSRTLRELLAKAAAENLSTAEVISRLCDEEKASRMKSAIAAKVKGARFLEINTVDGFDFDFCPVRRKLKARYLALHDVSFIDKGINPLFIGSPGTGNGIRPPRLVALRPSANSIPNRTKPGSSPSSGGRRRRRGCWWWSSMNG